MQEKCIPAFFCEKIKKPIDNITMLCYYALVR